ncbi:polysaccharide lyase 8 family protein [Streptomyces sp. NPDC048845]|uniref:polysaccharide lyase 8 family protein n=1 Tax=Streptomyces sp. NPDC048845 TaxID=3155390 RepID=UPI003422DC87
MPAPWARRGFVKAWGGGAAALCLGATASAAIPHSSAHAADEFDVLRAKWRQLILGSGFSATTEPFRSKLGRLGKDATAWRATMEPADGSLWPAMVWLDPEPDLDAESYAFSDQMRKTCQRLCSMAEAYAQPGTGLTGDDAYAEEIVAGIRHVVDEVYNPGRSRYGNWWNWQIGGPQALLDAAVLLYDHLGPELISSLTAAVDHFVPESAVAEYTGTSTGANRVDLCRVIMLRGIVGRSAAKITLARDALAPVFPYVTRGDGFYADGSFIQHSAIPYIGGYGAVLFDGVGLLFALLKGSSYERTDPGSRLFLDTVDNAVAPFVYNGLLMDGVSGRGISRDGADDHTRAHALLASILLIGQGAGIEERTRWQAMVKGWIERDTYKPATTNTGLSLVRLARLRSLMDDRAVVASEEPVGHRLFHNMDRVVHRRHTWAACLSMASERIAHYEFGNGENGRGFHTGAGWLSWWGDDFGNDQYSDAFWPTVNPYRLPGITASTRKLSYGEGGNWGNPKPDAAWVGGTTDGEYAAVGQHLKGLSSTMAANKSWFFLDDAVVCLGAGITAADGVPVETTVDNRNLGASGNPVLTVDGRVQPSYQGWTDSFQDIRWAHVEGHAGYVFPRGSTVNAVREARTGAWQDINTGGSPDPVTRRYLTLWHDHGTDPADATYVYVLLPGAGPGATSRRAGSNGWFRILSNSAGQQGIAVPRLGLTAVNFWARGEAGELSANAPCSVLVREHRDGTATVCVSDPARETTGLRVTWHRPVRSVLTRPSTLTSATTGRTLTLGFGDLTGQAGEPQKITVKPADWRSAPAVGNARPSGIEKSHA